MVDTPSEITPENHFRGTITEILRQDSQGIRFSLTTADDNELMITITHDDIARFGLKDMITPGTKIKWEMVGGCTFDNMELA